MVLVYSMTRNDREYFLPAIPAIRKQLFQNRFGKVCVRGYIDSDNKLGECLGCIPCLSNLASCTMQGVPLGKPVAACAVHPACCGSTFATLGKAYSALQFTAGFGTEVVSDGCRGRYEGLSSRTFPFPPPGSRVGIIISSESREGLRYV